MISDYNVTKAKVEFRGRKYEAWFSEEIPINAGPWKFFGLPGLILEVGSADGAVSIRLSEIKKMNDTEFPSFIKEATTMTRLAYNECLDKTYGNHSGTNLEIWFYHEFNENRTLK